VERAGRTTGYKTGRKVTLVVPVDPVLPEEEACRPDIQIVTEPKGKKGTNMDNTGRDTAAAVETRRSRATLATRTAPVTVRSEARMVAGLPTTQDNSGVLRELNIDDLSLRRGVAVETKNGRYRSDLTSLVLMPDCVLRTNPQQNFAFVLPRVSEEVADGGLIVNEATFGAGTDPDQTQLSAGGLRLRDTPNAGGSSVWSEVMSFEVLRELFGATLERTETEIEYQFFLGGGNSKITDYSVKMFDQVIGVSVTRALRFRAVFELEDAMHLLSKKLDGVNKSTEGVITPHAWSRQILHIWAESPYIADVLTEAYERIDAELRASTMVIVTVSRGGAEWLYRTPRVPRSSL
jgi:hypothetical protein